jgi:hypothetical protein
MEPEKFTSTNPLLAVKNTTYICEECLAFDLFRFLYGECAPGPNMIALQDTQFPLFDEVKAEHVVPGINQLIKDLNAEVDVLEKTVQPKWESLVEPLERIVDRLSRAWSTVSHLKASHVLGLQRATLSLSVREQGHN